jgi:phage/plasmid-associated DNA primase
MVNPVKLWRADPARKEYLEGAIMCPDGDTLDPGYFNLWQGYAVEPEKGDVSRFIEFMHKVLCNECEAHTEWLLDWTADLFQHTSNPKGVAIVMRGAEGIGKGTFANTLGHIIGAHFRHVTQESQLTGRFNAHFADSTLVFGDEMTWGGDKRNRGVLYSLITEKLLMVERKNFDAVPMRNLNRFIIASNNDWVVPTNIDGRRWFVLDPNESRKSDTTYFNKMRVWLENGGYRHILHYFLTRKITHDLRKAPVTQGLIDQKVNALSPIHQWWHECVERGSISPLAEGWPTDNTMEKERLYDYYKMYCKDVGVRIEPMTVFIRAVKKVVPMLEETRPRVEGKRVRLTILPALNEAAEYLDGLLKQTLTS